MNIKENYKMEIDEDETIKSKPIFELLHKAMGPPDVIDPETICKICLTNYHDISNPFINLCICDGSMRFIHYECLKKWMAIKLSIKKNDKQTVTSYNMKSFNCEICKTPYPCKF